MGNALCHTYGRKRTMMLNSLLYSEYDPAKTPDDRIIKDLIEYIENNLNKLYTIGTYVKDHIDKASRGLNSRKQASHFNTILNGFQMYENILKSVQRLVKTRRELAEVHNKAAIVKMKLKKSHKLKSKWKTKKVDSYFLVNYLKFQEVVFRAIKKMLAEDFTLKNAPEGRNEAELFKLILRNWNEIFAIWKRYELHNFDRNIKKIFELTSVRTQLFLNNEVITRTLADIFSICPMKMIRKCKNELLASIENVLLIKEEQPRVRGVKMLYALLLNIIANKDLVLVNNILTYYADKRPEVLYYLIGISKNSMEVQEILLEIIISRVKENDKYYELLYKLISTSPLNLLNYSNMILLTDIMLKLYLNPNIKAEEKYTFFAAFADRASQNFQIGLLAFLKNLFMQLIVITEALDEIYFSIVDYLSSKPKLLESEYLDKNIIRFVFELSDTSPQYLNLISLILKLRTAQGSKLEPSLVFKFIVKNLVDRAEVWVKEATLDRLSLLRFIWLMRAHLNLQNVITEEKTEMSLYIEFLTQVLGKTTNVLVLLFVFFTLYEFSRYHPINEDVLRLMEKYDDLLEKDTYKKCLVLLRSEEVDFGKADLEELNNEMSKDAVRFSTSDVNWLMKTLGEGYRLTKLTNETIVLNPIIDEATEQPNRETSYSIFDKTISRTDTNEIYSELAKKGFDELYAYNLKKNQELLKEERLLRV